MLLVCLLGQTFAFAPCVLFWLCVFVPPCASLRHARGRAVSAAGVASSAAGPLHGVLDVEEVARRFKVNYLASSRAKDARKRVAEEIFGVGRGADRQGCLLLCEVCHPNPGRP